MADSTSVPSTPLKGTNLSSLKVVELRAELTSRNLSPKGVKKDLVKRLQEALEEEHGDAQVVKENGNGEEAGVEEAAADEEGGVVVEGEEESKAKTKETPAKKTPKRNASAVDAETAGRRVSGRRGTIISHPSPLSMVPETPTRPASQRAGATDSEPLTTELISEPPETRDEVQEDAEGPTKAREERHEGEGDAENEGNKEKETAEEKAEDKVEEKAEGNAEAVEKSVPEEEPAPMVEAKVNDAVESGRKRTRTADDEGEKQTEDDAQFNATLPSPKSPKALLETKEPVEGMPQGDIANVSGKDVAQDVTNDLSERTTKRRRKEDEEADVNGDGEKRKEQDDRTEQRLENTVKRIYSPIKAPEPEPEPAKRVQEKEKEIEIVRCEPSPCIYISGLHRPLTAVMLKKKLGEYGTVEKMWMDRIKTRCYATFSDKAAAVSARTEMNDTVWPPNTGRTLTVDYLPAHRFDQLVKEEEKAIETGRKLSLTPDSDPNLAVRLVDIFSISVPPNSSSSFTTSAPSANSSVLSGRLGPPFGRPAPEIRTRDVPPKSRASITLSPSSPPASAIPPLAKTIPLDTLFRKTTAKPHLYYLPLTDEQVAERKTRAGIAVAGSRRN